MTLSNSEMREEISNLMADLMIETKLIKLDDRQGMIRQGRELIQKHNAKLNIVLALIDKQVIEALAQQREDIRSKLPEKIRSNSAYVQVGDPVMRQFKQAEANAHNKLHDQITKILEQPTNLKGQED